MNNLLKKIKLREIIIFIGILLLFLYLDSFLLIIFYYPNIKAIDLNHAVLLIIVKYLILITIFILMYHKYLKEKWFDFKKNIKKYFEISFKNWFLGFMIMVVSNLIINYFFPGLGKNEDSIQLLISKIPLIAFLLTTVFAPFVEEMIFRKYLQDAVNNKIVFMITSGLLFGLIHVMGGNSYLEYLLIIPYGALGFVFAKTINETDNIYNTILMHMLHNGALTLLAILVG